MKRFLKVTALLALGFALYPALFVPAMNVWFPETLDKWIDVYGQYLSVWGL